MQARPSRFLAAALALALGSVGRVGAQIPSPFQPAAGDAAVAAPSETFEFSGVTVIGKQTLINIYDKTAKKSRWIPLKETVDGISVLTYDARRDQVVVKIGDEQKLLTLRKSTGPANAPTVTLAAPNPANNFNVPTPPTNELVQKIQPPPPASEAAPPPLPTNPPETATAAAAPAPGKPETPAKPLSIARQEEEARMLVSDLLEIGMAQRKAYEEKQRQAATGEQNAAATPPPATPPATPHPNNGS